MKLSLKREALSELSAQELVTVHGGALPAPRTLNVQECYGDLFTHHSAVDCLTRNTCA